VVAVRHLISSVLWFSLPLWATVGYPYLFELGWNLPPRYAWPPAIYGACVAAAATILESDVLKRLRRCAIVASVSMLFAATFDVIMIIGVSLAAGLLAVNGVPSHRTATVWVRLLYRILRAFTAGTIAFLSLMLLLPNSGMCPAGGGDITDAHVTFAIVTYLTIGGMILLDSCWYLVPDEHCNRSFFG
jgi:hypothetical protein